MWVVLVFLTWLGTPNSILKKSNILFLGVGPHPGDTKKGDIYPGLTTCGYEKSDDINVAFFLAHAMRAIYAMREFGSCFEEDHPVPSGNLT